jgi:hypothetical protein
MIIPAGAMDAARRRPSPPLALASSEQRNPCLDEMDNREKFCKWIY